MKKVAGIATVLRAFHAVLMISAASAFTLLGCASMAKPKDAPIVKANTAEQYDQAGLARWSITLYSGHGIPGSPGADVYIPNAIEVAQKIVDDCKLGDAIYAEATDGVSILSIKNHDLSKQKIACIRAAERPGLFLNDKGAE
jgi:hypothetical protein